RGGFHLDENGRLILARLKISDDGGRDEDEKESEQDKRPADANYTPVIQKMNFDFVSCDHIREWFWREQTTLATRPSKAKKPAPYVPRMSNKTRRPPDSDCSAGPPCPRSPRCSDTQAGLR